MSLGPADASKNVVRLANFELTFFLLYHELHDVYRFTHIVLRAEVSPCVDPGKPRVTSSTQCPAKEC